uniref:Uncharacterized protein n=1 Tax=Anguilla anguilla TaxID=7936 RepID=A0A0E9VY26_ANGAN
MIVLCPPTLKRCGNYLLTSTSIWHSAQGQWEPIQCKELQYCPISIRE